MTRTYTGTNATRQFVVLEGIRDTARWVDEVCRASDSHRNELGFLARSVFAQFAHRDGLYVLVEQAIDGQHYAGHLLFDRRFPRAHVRQIFTLAKHRRQGVASLLLSHLRESLTRNSFISIYARVAEDLAGANDFWHRQGFYVQRSEKGGASRNRQILVRCQELGSPQLFPVSGMSEQNPLGLRSPANELPMFLLDMNVLFDVQPRRFRRTEVIGLFQAERMNFCRLAISSEVREELGRNLKSRTTDPMEAYVDTFPCFPVHPYGEPEAILPEIAPIVFPESVARGPLTANERSDLRHIITAVLNDLAGLITNDGALLKAAAAIEKKFGVQVLSPRAFEIEDSQAQSTEAFETVHKKTLHLVPISNNIESSVRALLTQKIQLSGSAIASGWLPMNAQDRGAARYAVWSGSACVGYITWSARIGAEAATVVKAAVDESHSQALETARILLVYLLDRLSGEGPCQVRLELPQHQSFLREVGAGLGFVGDRQSHALMKSVMGGVLTSSTWSACRAAMAAAGGPRLPADPTSYRAPDQQIEVLTPNGNRAYVGLDRLESLLAPALLCLPGRPAVISPVRRTYAEPLLGHSRQGSLLPQASASLFTDRIYLSHPSTLRHFRRGTLLLFYESSRQGGRCQIVAIARVREAYLKACDTFEVSDLQQAVLTTETLSDIGKSTMKTVTLFDNIFPLPNPVGIRTLQRLGCGRPNDLITTHAISDTQLDAILSEGFGRG